MKSYSVKDIVAESDVFIDENLWFTLKDHDCSGKHYIIGNPHTSPGRIMGFCTVRNESFYISLNDIEEMSLETKYWLKGFLVGSEPEPPVGEDGVDFESADYKKWEECIALYHKTGYWNPDRKCSVCGKPLLSSWIGWECAGCKSED